MNTGKTTPKLLTQKQETETETENHNKTTAIERSVLNNLGA